jgi:hypothetical protein
MTFRFVLLLGILFALAVPATAQSDRSGNPGTKARKDSAAKKDAEPKKESMLNTPMVFYLAKGEDGACGPGCSEWIAAEGGFDLGAAQRLRTLLTRLGKRKLPIFFHSPGGLGNVAMTMGRLLREREMTAGVSETIPAGCVAASAQACQALKRSGQALAAELRNLGVCASACVYALIGAKVRTVPPGARLGVHSGKLVLIHPDGRTRTPAEGKLSSSERARSREIDGQLRRYVVEMKVDNALSDLSATIPHENVHFLSRDEIARFGIDTRAFSESRWTTMENTSKEPLTVKFIVEAKGASRGEFRASMIHVECAGPQRTRMVYMRGLASDEIATRPTIKLVVDGGSALFSGYGSVMKVDQIDTGGSFNMWAAYYPLAFFDAAAAHDAIDIVETGSAGATARTIKLSTAGLSQAIAKLRPQCGAAPGCGPSGPQGAGAASPNCVPPSAPASTAPFTGDGTEGVPYLDLQQKL